MHAPYQIVLLFFVWTCHQHPLVSGKPLDIFIPHKFKSRPRRYGDELKHLELELNFGNEEDTLQSTFPGDHKSAPMVHFWPSMQAENGPSKLDESIRRNQNSRSLESVWQEQSEVLNLPEGDFLTRKKPTDTTASPKPTKPSKPTKTPKPTKPTKPPKPTKSTKLPKPTKPAKPEVIESTMSTSSTTKDPMEAYCEVACEEGIGGPECDCPGHPIG